MTWMRWQNKQKAPALSSKQRITRAIKSNDVVVLFFRQAGADAGERAWRAWGPYLAERQWGTVREDYSAQGNNWSDFSHEASLGSE